MTDFTVNPGEEVAAITSLTLLERARHNDKKAWDRLVDLYTPLVCYWCQLRGLQERGDVEEISQEVFLAVHSHLGDFHRDQEGDTFRGWLRTITQNKINDHVPPPGGKGVGGTDVQMRLQELASTYPGGEGNTDCQAVEKFILYNRAVELIESSFEPSSRRAFWLVIGGQKPKDVAAELGMTVAAVYLAKSRILQRLRSEFRGLLEHCE
jgi:RNA polymerase sigma-70 factor, ECF subfamily